MRWRAIGLSARRERAPPVSVSPIASRGNGDTDRQRDEAGEDQKRSDAVDQHDADDQQRDAQTHQTA